MHICLELTTRRYDGLHGSATWVGQPNPQRFHGVLELMALLEAAARAAQDAEDPEASRP